ncbi:MAG: hypothetical protein GF350_09475, partial [Chitinivibrionales bacterium]|nr:hypothetical protein [Chitinivibrionales bacterium]
MKRGTLFLLCIVSLLAAESMNILFLGIFEGAAPSFEKSFEQMVRDNISTCDGTDVFDKAQTEKFRSMLDFRGNPSLSGKMVAALKRHYMDTILVVWGEIREYDISTVRRHLIGTGIRGTVRA